tara:strand:- start:1039 stop:2346 length:1308 start_codon:yes stop_codon:yes gene_type:complete
MKSFFSSPFSTVFLLVSLCTATVYSQNQEKYIEGVAAIVGDNIILKSDLSQVVSMTALQQRIDPKNNPKRFQTLQYEVLQSLVDQKIILEMAELDSIEVKEKEVDKALNQQIETFVSQAGSEEKAETSLGQSLSSFRREFWYEMRDRLISEQFQYSLLSNIKTNREDVFSFFKTYKDSLPLFPSLVNLNHLLITIKPSKESKNTALKQIKDIRIQILGGEPFESLAQTFSEDPGSKSKGGSLGLVSRGSLVKEFETVAFTLEPGIVSDPVETVFGYHLINVQEKQGDKVKVNHILISPKIKEKDEQRTYDVALSLRDSIFSFEEFKKFADKYSDDEKTKKVGGNIGWINPLNYSISGISFFIQQNNLGLNECSMPVKTDYGYHLLWISAIKPGGKPNLSDHWVDIELMALNQKKMLWYRNWMEEAKKQVYIQIYE